MRNKLGYFVLAAAAAAVASAVTVNLIATPFDFVSATVTINKDCSVDRDWVAIEARGWTGGCSANQPCAVTWALERNDQDMSVPADWQAQVIPKDADDQDSSDSDRGRKIKKRLNNGNNVQPIRRGAARSVQPKRRGPFVNDEFVWKYSVRLLNGGGDEVCRVDPDVCVRKKGSNGCVDALAGQPLLPGDTLPITVDKDCSVKDAQGNKLDYAVINGRANAGGANPSKPFAVEWKRGNLDAGWRAFVIAKPPFGQDPTDAGRGARVRKMIGKGNRIEAVDSPIGHKPNKPYFAGYKGNEVLWRYGVEVYDASGKYVCHEDPDVCVKKQGSNGCAG